MADNENGLELVVEPRSITGKHVAKLRREELLPGVIYGHNVQAESVQVSQRLFERIYRRAGATTLVDVKMGEGGAARKVFIHEVQRNPVSHVPRHVDFLVVNLKEEMNVQIPITLTGESPAVENNLGILILGVDHVEVRALPGDIPSVLHADLSSLDEVDKTLYVSDLKIPEGVTVLTPGDELIAKVTETRYEEAAAAEEEAPAEEAAEAGAAEEGSEPEREA